MGRSPRLTVLVAEPRPVSHASVGTCYPYLWAQLKSYHERHGATPADFSWLDPVFLPRPPETVIGAIPTDRLDVLALSTYCWNRAYVAELARLAKRRWPSVLVVAGGPEPDHERPGFFLRQPDVDVLALRDGELTFSAILDRVSAGGRVFTDVPGLCLPSDPERASLVRTGPARLPTRFDHSPYADQAAYYERIAGLFGPGSLAAIWETNRGCPYACSFCDWGSSTNSSVRPFDMERVQADLEFIARVLKPSLTHLADANLGILPRDPEIAEMVVRAVERWGYPRPLYYNAAKNHPARVAKVARTLYAGRTTWWHPFGLQHTHPEVLEAIDRRNIPVERFRELLDDLSGNGVEVAPQLILGIPNDTVDRWKDCIATLLDWGLHKPPYVFHFILSTNAPASDPDFLQRWAVETNRIATNVEGRLDSESPVSFEEDVIVACRSFDRADWVRMRVWTAVLQALHFHPILRLPAIYLHDVHGVSYRAFYDSLTDDFLASHPRWSALLRRVTEHFEGLSRQPGASDWMAVKELPDLRLRLAPHLWLFVQLCLEIDDFIESVTPFLERAFPGGAALRDCVRYGRQVLLLPDYDPRAGRDIAVDFDWPRFFSQERVKPGGGPSCDPARVLGGCARVDDREVGLPINRMSIEAADDVTEARWCRWVSSLVMDGPNFDLELRQTRLVALFHEETDRVGSASFR